MQGLVEKTNANTHFLVVKHHSICEESKQPREGFSPIEVKNPKSGELITKYIKQYKSVEALVCAIDWYDTKEKYETRFMGWKISLNANGVPAILDLPFESRAAGRFMKLAENLDFTKPVEFTAWHDVKTDSTAFNVKQDGKSVPQVYTQENPGECPAPVQNKIGKWNFDAQKMFLLERMETVVIPAVEKVGNKMPVAEQTQAASVGGTVPQRAPDEWDENNPVF